MATFHGKEGVVKNGSNAVAEVNSFTLNSSVETSDDTVMGDTWRSHKTGFKTWNGTVECQWDDTDTNGQESFTEGASVTIHLLPEGTDTGSYDYTGTATITEVVHNQVKDGIVTRTFNFLGNGALSRTTA